MGLYVYAVFPLVSFPDPQYVHIEGLGTRLGVWAQDCFPQS